MGKKKMRKASKKGEPLNRDWYQGGKDGESPQRKKMSGKKIVTQGRRLIEYLDISKLLGGAWRIERC